jgi:hypothetical protein
VGNQQSELTILHHKGRLDKLFGIELIQLWFSWLDCDMNAEQLLKGILSVCCPPVAHIFVKSLDYTVATLAPASCTDVGMQPTSE